MCALQSSFIVLEDSTRTVTINSHQVPTDTGLLKTRQTLADFYDKNFWIIFEVHTIYTNEAWSTHVIVFRAPGPVIYIWEDIYIKL